MSNENNRKTLVTCKNSEFLAAAMQTRKLVYEYYSKIDAKGIAEKFKNTFDKKDGGKPAEVTVGDCLSFISEIIEQIFIEFPEETVRIAAIAGFMTIEEAESIDPSELYEILLECALSQRVLDFFINLDRSVSRNTEGIYRALIYLRVISGGLTSSASKSQTSSSEKSEAPSVGDTSESAPESPQAAL